MCEYMNACCGKSKRLTMAFTLKNWCTARKLDALVEYENIGNQTNLNVFVKILTKCFDIKTSEQGYSYAEQTLHYV